MRLKKYADMYDMPHHVSKRHPQMDILNRAGQFAPFAALTGFEDQISEEARTTIDRKILTEEEKQALDQALQLIDQGNNKICVEYYVEDELKEGGSYEIYKGVVRRIDRTMRLLIFKEGRIIELDSISKITISEEDE